MPSPRTSAKPAAKKKAVARPPAAKKKAAKKRGIKPVGEVRMGTRIEFVKFSALVPFDEAFPNIRNPRIHTPRQLEGLRRAFMEEGQNRGPLTIDEQGVVLCGNGRLMALVKMSEEELKQIPGLPVGRAACLRIAGLPIYKKIRLALNDNRISAMGEDDPEALRDAMTAVAEAGGNDANERRKLFEGFGYDEEEVEAAIAVLDAVAPDEGGKGADPASPAPKALYRPGTAAAERADFTAPPGAGQVADPAALGGAARGRKQQGDFIIPDEALDGFEADMKAPMVYHGGSSRYLPDINALLNAARAERPFTSLIDAFVGSGSVPLSRTREMNGGVEIVNDLADVVVNFWTAIQTRWPELEALVEERFQHSYKWFELSRAIVRGEKEADAPEQAWALFACSGMSFGSTMGSRFNSSTRENRASTYAYKVDKFRKDYRDRIRHWSIHKMDAADFILKYGGDPDAMFFVDPPYLGSAYGPHWPKFGEADFRNLLVALSKSSGRFLMTSFKHPLLDEFAKKFGWSRMESTEPSRLSVGTYGHGNERKLQTQVFTVNWRPPWEGA